MAVRDIGSFVTCCDGCCGTGTVPAVPKYVDHTAQRQLVTQVAAEIVAAHGVEALTVRAVAAGAGYSTAVVSHYFTDKRDLLRSTYRAAANRSTLRLQSAGQRSSRSIAGCLEALLPVDEDSRRDWRVFIAFWGVAAVDDELRVEQADRVRTARERIVELLTDRGYGQALTRSDLRLRARGLLTVVQGIAVQAMFDPDDWTPRRQADELRRGTARILPVSDRPAGASA